MVYLIVLLALFSPGIKISLNIPSFRPEDVLVLLTLFYFVLSGRKFSNVFLPREFGFFSRGYGLMLLYTLIVTLAFLPIVASVKIPLTVNKSLGVFRPFLLGLAVFQLVKTGRQSTRLGNMLVWSIFVIVGVMICQQNNLFGVNQWLTPLYRFDELTSAQLSGRRVTGVRGNPNDIGTILSILGTLAMAKAIFSREAGTRRLLGFAAALAAALGCIWLAKTRQGTVGLAAGWFIVFLASLRISGRRISGTVFLLLTIIGAVAGAAFMLGSGYLGERFSVLLGGGSVLQDSSIAARLYLWPQFFDEVGLWALIGRGMSAMVLETVWDSGYLYILVSGGIPALTAWMVMTFGVSLRAWRHVRIKGLVDNQTWLHITCYAILFVILLTNILNNTAHNPVVMTIIASVYAMSAAARKAEAEDVFGVVDAPYDPTMIPRAYHSGIVLPGSGRLT